MSGLLLLGLRILATLALYGFLAWAFYLLWRTLRAQAEIQKSQVPPIIGLEMNGEITRLERAEILIGRDSASTFPLQDSAVSAYHTRLSYHHGQWWAEDMNSKNGTLLNEEPLTTPTVLTDNDHLTCGNSQIIIHLPEKRGEAQEHQL